MAKKPRALGNDPFRRGAAVRTGAGQQEPEREKKAAAAAEPSAPRRTAEPEREKKAAAAAEPSAPRRTAEPEREKKASAAAEAAPARAPTREKKAAPAEDIAATAAPIARPRTAERPTAPRRAAARRASDSTSDNADEIARDAGLLPTDLDAAPSEPSVVAVGPIPPALPADRLEPPPAPPRQSEVHRRGDAASASLVLLRQLLGLPAAAPSFDVDELGYDPNFEEQVRPALDWIYDRWFRVELHGGDRLPQSGPVVLVANRAGAVPWDSAMLALACRRLGRDVRPLVEDDLFHFPALGVVINRLGAVRACPENAEHILGQGGAVAVFPEGATGFGKPFRERYRLQRFGRGGFAKLALRMGARIVPVSIVGSEETQPLLGKLHARSLGMPFLPLTPTFPWLGLAGLVPLPSKWHIEIGEPVDLGRLGPEAAKDDPLVLRLAEHVRGTIQGMIDERLAQRRSVFGG